MGNFDRFIPWRKRKCCYCGNPLSEKVKYTIGANGKRKKIYCCNICYGLHQLEPKHMRKPLKHVDDIG